MTVLQLRALREAAGMSQTELAEAAETTQRTISRLEADGKERADLELLLRICRVFGVTMAELVPLERSNKRKK